MIQIQGALKQFTRRRDDFAMRRDLKMFDKIADPGPAFRRRECIGHFCENPIGRQDVEMHIARKLQNTPVMLIAMADAGDKIKGVGENDFHSCLRPWR